MLIISSARKRNCVHSFIIIYQFSRLPDHLASYEQRFMMVFIKLSARKRQVMFDLTFSCSPSIFWMRQYISNISLHNSFVTFVCVSDCIKISWYFSQCIQPPYSIMYLNICHILTSLFLSLIFSPYIYIHIYIYR